MKRKILAVIMAATLATTPVTAKGIRIPTIKLMHDTGTDKNDYTITHRKGTILITWETGTVLNKKKDGRLDVVDPYYNYISYRGIDCHKGDKILTIDIWNPDNNYCDDIVSRCDFVIDCPHKK